MPCFSLGFLLYGLLNPTSYWAFFLVGFGRDGTRIQNLEGQYNFLEGANIIFLGLIF